MARVRTTITVELTGNGTHDQLVEAFHDQLEAMVEHDVPAGYVNNDGRTVVKIACFDPAPDGQENL